MAQKPTYFSGEAVLILALPSALRASGWSLAILFTLAALVAQGNRHRKFLCFLPRYDCFRFRDRLCGAGTQGFVVD